MNALELVQERFPNVNKVMDAKHSVTVQVTPRDTNSSKVKKHEECAMAVACKRQMKSVTGVIVGLKVAYVVKGSKAYRFTVPEATSREVVSFDRSGPGGFEPGKYQLTPPSPSNRIGTRQRRQNSSRSHKKTSAGPSKFSKRFAHRTENVRAKLGTPE